MKREVLTIESYQFELSFCVVREIRSIELRCVYVSIGHEK